MSELKSQIIRWIKSLSDNDQVQELMTASLGRLALKQAAISNSFDPSMFPSAKVRHVVDWLTASVVNQAAWLNKVDQFGRPMKLVKLQSLEAAVKEADKAMILAAQQMPKNAVSGDDEDVYTELDNGAYLVRLKTPNALDRESSAMQHCIGNGSYDQYLKSRIYLSLRDRFGKAHATLEIDPENNSIYQLKGKQNKTPDQKYLDRLAPFIISRKYKLIDASYSTGLVQDRELQLHSIHDMPDGIIIEGDLDLSYTTPRSLPNGLTIGRDFFLIGSSIQSLPEGLIVRRDLHLRNSSIQSLPRNLLVDRDLCLSGTSIQSLPEGLTVGRYIDLRGASVQSLPDDIRAGGVFFNKRLLDVEEAKLALQQQIQAFAA